MLKNNASIHPPDSDLDLSENGGCRPPDPICFPE